MMATTLTGKLSQIPANTSIRGLKIAWLTSRSYVYSRHLVTIEAEVGVVILRDQNMKKGAKKCVV